jgi:hypothetical protein
VDRPQPILDSALRIELGRNWLGITRDGDKVFGCLHGSVTRFGDSTVAVRATSMQMAYIDGGDCYGTDAVGIVSFVGPKPADIVDYYLDLSRREAKMFCLRPGWLMVGTAYDTDGGRLRTSWTVRTPDAAAKCAAGSSPQFGVIEFDLRSGGAMSIRER